MTSARKRARGSENPWLARGEGMVLAGEAAQAGEDIKQLLSTKFVSGDMTAELLCKIAYLHQTSGGCGLEDYAMHPDRKNTGNYNRKLQSRLAKDYHTPDLFTINVPLYDKMSCARQLTPVPVRLPHEAISEDWAGAPHDEGVDQGESVWGQAYASHTVVQRGLQTVHWSKVRPVAIHIDSTKYTQRDSFVGVFYTDLRSDKKYMFCVLRVGLNIHAQGNNGNNIVLEVVTQTWRLRFAAQRLAFAVFATYCLCHML